MESRLFAWKAGGDMDGGEERWGKELEHWDLLQIKPGVKKNTMVAEDGNQLDGRAFPYRSASQIERWMVPSGRAVKAVDRAETRSHLWKGRSPMTKDRIIQRRERVRRRPPHRRPRLHVSLPRVTPALKSHVHGTTPLPPSLSMSILQARDAAHNNTLSLVCAIVGGTSAGVIIAVVAILGWRRTRRARPGQPHVSCSPVVYRAY